MSKLRHHSPLLRRTKRDARGDDSLHHHGRKHFIQTKRCISYPREVMRMEFKDDEYAPRLMHQLNRQRHRGQHCNLELRVGSRVFRAHREVLAAVSPSVEHELDRNDVQAHDSFIIAISTECMNAEAVEELLTFLYTGRVLLAENNVEDLLRGAKYFRVPDLHAHCCEFLLQTLSPDNCLRYLELAERRQQPELAERAYCLLRDGFHAQSARQLAECPQHVLWRLVRDEELRANSEDQVLLALAHWARGNPLEEGAGDRVDAFESMFGHVILRAVSEDVLHAVAADKLMTNRCPSVLARVEAEIANRKKSPTLSEPVSQKLRRMVLLQRKGALLDAVLILGGQHADGSFSNAVFAYIVAENIWLKLADMPYQAAALAATALGKHIYVTGGISEETVGLRVAWRYNIGTGSWTKLPDLPQGLVFHSMVSCSGKVYTLGGSVAPCKYTSHIYSYNPSKETWSLAGKMSVPMEGTEVITKDDKCIYIVTGRCVFKGAISRVGVVDCFNTATHEVGQCMTLPIQFRHRPLISFQDENLLSVQSHEQSLEIDLQKVRATNTPRTVPLMPGHLMLDINHAICSLPGNKVFVCGGVVSDDKQNGPPYNINQNTFLFNRKKDEWQMLAPPPEALDCAACCTVKLPRQILLKDENQP